MIYVRCTVAGLLAILAATILLVIVVMAAISIASRSSRVGSVGWDPISFASPFTWLMALVRYFLGRVLLGVLSAQVEVASCRDRRETKNSAMTWCLGAVFWQGHHADLKRGITGCEH
jgi:hypothetical protein